MRMTNIPVLLELSGKNIAGATLFGTVVPDIEIPSKFVNIKHTGRGDEYVLMDLVGIESSGVYGFASGQVLTSVPSDIVASARSKKSGRLGVVLTNATLKLDDFETTDFVTFFKWTKRNTGWGVTAPTVAILTHEAFPEYYKVVLEGFKNGWQFTYPAQLDRNYRKCGDGCNYNYADGTPFNKQAVAVTGQSGATPQSNATQQGTMAPNSPQEPTQLPPQQPNPTNESPSEGVTIQKPEGWGIGAGGGSVIPDYTTAPSALPQKKQPKDTGLEDGIRANLAPKSENFLTMEKEVQIAGGKVDALLEYLTNLSVNDITSVPTELQDENSDANEMTSIRLNQRVQQLISNLKNNWSRSQGSYTGRALFKLACSKILPDSFSVRGTLDEALDVIGANLVDYMDYAYFCSQGVKEGENATPVERLKREIASEGCTLYYQMLDILLGTDKGLVSAYRTSTKTAVSLECVIAENPYMLCALDPTFKIEELDKIAMLSGVDRGKQEIRRARNMAYMHNFLLDQMNKGVGDNTIIKLSTLLRNVRAGYVVSKRTYNIISADGSFVKYDDVEALKSFFTFSVDHSNFAIDVGGWVRQGLKMRKDIAGIDVQSMIADYIKSGLGVRLDLDGISYIADYVFAHKECYIYNRLYDLSSEPVKDLTDKQLNDCVTNFEKLKTKELKLSTPFKLEQRQADGVRLIKNPVMCLTGPAGSGKTTTAEGLVYGAESLLNLDGNEIVFCAPTGKAANRLKEVVKRRTRTINSLFGIGGDSMRLKNPEGVKKREEFKLIVVDEMSMPNLNIFYEMMLRVADGTHMYFLGDIEQLPPIGFGKPFANMLQFLPTVFLNVTKRASEKSGISFNAKRIINESDGVIEDLEEREDFKIVQTTDINRAVMAVTGICNFHLGKGDLPDGITGVENMGVNLDPDDIQVITPINTKVWGTRELNKRLQDIFNPRKPRETYLSFARGKEDVLEYRKGDRVIHTESNERSRMRFKQMDSGKFKKIAQTGISNGEQGKIVGFFKPSKLEFEDSVDETAESIKTLFLGDDATTIFVAVKFKDINEDTGEPYDFIIFYRATITIDMGYEINVVSSELRKLDLAYALTTHKLQGSEAKLVLFVLFKAGYSGFISRNMIYTGESRAKVAEYLIGDILGRNSAVNEGRKVKQTEVRMSMLDNI